MKVVAWLTVVAIGLILVFAFLRLRHYLDQRRRGHDDYKVYPCADGGRNGKTTAQCPPMNMFGLKLSVIMVVAGINLVLTLYMLAVLNKAA